MGSNFQEITFSIAEVAKMTRFPHGEYKFFEWLRKHRFLLNNNQPSDFQIKRGWFVLESKKVGMCTNLREIPVSRVTSKGLAGLEKIINRSFPLCPPCAESLKNNNI
jgi:phage antirepressor YoqD-like protein